MVILIFSKMVRRTQKKGFFPSVLVGVFIALFAVAAAQDPLDGPVEWADMTDTSLRNLEYGIPAGTRRLSDIIPDNLIKDVTGRTWRRHQIQIGKSCRGELREDFAACVWSRWVDLKEKIDDLYAIRSPINQSPVTWDMITMAFHFKACRILRKTPGPKYVEPHCPSPCAADPCKGGACEDISQFAGQYRCLNDQGTTAPESVISIEVESDGNDELPASIVPVQKVEMPASIVPVQEGSEEYEASEVEEVEFATERTPIKETTIEKTKLEVYGEDEEDVQDVPSSRMTPVRPSKAAFTKVNVEKKQIKTFSESEQTIQSVVPSVVPTANIVPRPSIVPRPRKVARPSIVPKAPTPSIIARPSIVPRPSIVARPSIVPRPSIVARPSIVPRPSIVARPSIVLTPSIVARPSIVPEAPRPSIVPRASIVPEIQQEAESVISIEVDQNDESPASIVPEQEVSEVELPASIVPVEVVDEVEMPASIVPVEVVDEVKMPASIVPMQEGSEEYESSEVEEVEFATERTPIKETMIEKTMLEVYGEDEKDVQDVPSSRMTPVRPSKVALTKVNVEKKQIKTFSESEQTIPSVAPSVVPRANIVPRPSIVARPSIVPRPSIVARPSIVPRPSIVARPSIVPTPSIIARPSIVPEAPRPSIVPRASIVPEIQQEAESVISIEIEANRNDESPASIVPEQEVSEVELPASIVPVEEIDDVEMPASIVPVQDGNEEYESSEVEEVEFATERTPIKETMIEKTKLEVYGEDEEDVQDVPFNNLSPVRPSKVALTKVNVEKKQIKTFSENEPTSNLPEVPRASIVPDVPRASIVPDLPRPSIMSASIVPGIPRPSIVPASIVPEESSPSVVPKILKKIHRSKVTIYGTGTPAPASGTTPRPRKHKARPSAISRTDIKNLLREMIIRRDPASRPSLMPSKEPYLILKSGKKIPYKFWKALNNRLRSRGTPVPSIVPTDAAESITSLPVSKTIKSHVHKHKKVSNHPRPQGAEPLIQLKNGEWVPLKYFNTKQDGSEQLSRERRAAGNAPVTVKVKAPASSAKNEKNNQEKLNTKEKKPTNVKIVVEEKMIDEAAAEAASPPLPDNHMAPLPWNSFQDNDLKSFQAGYPTDVGVDSFEELLEETLPDGADGVEWDDFLGVVDERCKGKNGHGLSSCVWSELRGLKKETDEASKGSSPMSWELLTVAYLYKVCGNPASPGSPKVTPSCPSACAAHPCDSNAGTLNTIHNCFPQSQLAEDYKCECHLGFTWDSESQECVAKIPECSVKNSTCQEKGTEKCKSENGGYTCTCKEGYGGKLCEIEVAKAIKAEEESKPKVAQAQVAVQEGPGFWSPLTMTLMLVCLILLGIIAATSIICFLSTRKKAEEGAKGSASNTGSVAGSIAGSKAGSQAGSKAAGPGSRSAIKLPTGSLCGMGSVHGGSRATLLSQGAQQIDSVPRPSTSHQGSRQASAVKLD